MFKTDLFPLNRSFIIFLLYVSVFVSQGLLVTNSQESFKSYNYSTTLAVLITELIKLMISFSIYCFRNSLESFFEQIILHIKLLWLYLIPAFLYCLYNNLSYINLLHYDPATYFILLQLRVVITGILFQIFFRKTLTCMQWSSLIILTVGCMLKNVQFDQFDFLRHKSGSMQTMENNYIFPRNEGFSLNTALILLQIVCSCLAGVYCEFLLKIEGVHIDIFIQNVFMYIDSILCNLLIFAFQWHPNLYAEKLLLDIVQPKVMIVILNSAAGGVITSFFLKHLNSILKTVAAAVEMVFIAFLSWIFFKISIKLNTIISICMILLAIILYSQNPVKNPRSNIIPKKSETV